MYRTAATATAVAQRRRTVWGAMEDWAATGLSTAEVPVLAAAVAAARATARGAEGGGGSAQRGEDVHHEAAIMSGHATAARGLLLELLLPIYISCGTNSCCCARKGRDARRHATSTAALVR